MIKVSLERSCNNLQDRFFLISTISGEICSASVDIIYLMDSSASVGPYEYKQEKRFVKDLARIFEIGPSRAGVVIYSDEPKVMVKFGDQDNLQSFAKAIDDIRFMEGRTRIDKALKKVSELFLTARPRTPKVSTTHCQNLA